MTLAQKFKTYTDFANSDVAQILGEEKVKEAKKFEIHTLETKLLINDGTGHFVEKQLPIEAQFSPTFGIETSDFNEDGLIDIFLVGNLYDMEIETPSQDAGRGTILINKGNLEFEALNSIESGVSINKNMRDIKAIQVNNEKTCFVVSSNNDELSFYCLNK